MYAVFSFFLMGKTYLPLVFVALLLVAVFFLDAGREKITGKNVDDLALAEDIRKNILDDAPTSEQSARSSLQNPVVDAVVQAPPTGGNTQSLSPWQPIAERLCGITDLTPIVRKHLPPLQKITGMVDVEDRQRRLFLIAALDLAGGSVWYLYDVGQDGVFSNDDKVYLGGQDVITGYMVT